MKIDVHQHLWSEPLVQALEARRELPFVRHEHGLTVLFGAGERPYVIDLQSEEPERRAALVDPADPRDVDRALERGCVGVSLPAGALGSVEALSRLRPLLARLERAGAPLLVHSGPGPGRLPGAVAGETSLADPLWWSALTRYVSDMHAAWLAFISAGRPAHPELRVVFTMLAGLAPLHADRPEEWIGRVKHDASRRVYEELLSDAHVTAWLICWMDDHDTGFHDHDLSAGAVAVVGGRVREERLAIGGGRSVGDDPVEIGQHTRTFAAGQSFHLSPADIHRVRQGGPDPAVTLHVYSPPLARMGAYVVGDDGALARHPMASSEELRPLEKAAEPPSARPQAA